MMIPKTMMKTMTTSEGELYEERTVETRNDFALAAGENLPNHSASMVGRGKFIRQSSYEVATFRDRQMAYRYAAWLVLMADVLPDADGQEGIAFDDVLSAISDT
jgi:hypothetical protein